MVNKTHDELSAVAVLREDACLQLAILHTTHRHGSNFVGAGLAKTHTHSEGEHSPRRLEGGPMFHRFLEASPWLLAAYLTGHVIAALVTGGVR